LHKDAARVLFTADEIAAKVRELGAQITRDYAGKEVVLVGILKGAVVFLSDLARAIDIPASLDFMSVSSYGHSTTSSGIVRIIKDLDESIEGKHVIVVEDIVDTGLTLKYLRETLAGRGPASLRICAFLDKESRRQVDVKVDYIGFPIPDEFVVGYGLDFAGKYRNHPEVFILKPEAYGQPS
jgi:hypoxanthine phosphoribosyltransferase